MNFSLINVYRQTGNIIEGNWMQDHCAGTLESAIAAAKRTEEVNSNAIDIAVVDALGGYPQRRLDTQRVNKTHLPHPAAAWAK